MIVFGLMHKVGDGLVQFVRWVSHHFDDAGSVVPDLIVLWVLVSEATSPFQFLIKVETKLLQDLSSITPI